MSPPRPHASFAWAVALLAVCLDGLWAWQALSAVPKTAGSAVALASFAVWMVFHLPATALGGGLLKLLGLFSGDAQGLAPSARAILAAAGLAQTFGLVYGLAAWWGRRR